MLLKEMLTKKSSSLVVATRQRDSVTLQGWASQQTIPANGIRELGHCVLEKAASRSDFLLGRRLCDAANGYRGLFRPSELDRALEIVSCKE